MPAWYNASKSARQCGSFDDSDPRYRARRKRARLGLVWGWTFAVMKIWNNIHGLDNVAETRSGRRHIFSAHISGNLILESLSLTRSLLASWPFEVQAVLRVPEELSHGWLDNRRNT